MSVSGRPFHSEGFLHVMTGWLHIGDFGNEEYEDLCDAYCDDLEEEAEVADCAATLDWAQHLFVSPE